MFFINKSITRKFSSVLVLVVLSIIGIAYIVFDGGSINFKTFLISFGLIFVVMFLIYYLTVARPLRTVLTQIQALLANKAYKKIYTTRVDEIGIIAHFFNSITKGLGSVSSDLKEHERILDELTIASQLQRDILPLESPVIPGLQIVAKNKPASELGGDSFNIIQVGSKTFVYIGDVTGHGAAAGLMMTMVDSLVSVFADIYGSAFEIVVHVNKYIKRHVKKSMFMTMTLLCWDQASQKLTFVGAGHEHILVYRSASGECESILAGGIALGMLPDNSKSIKELEIVLADGDFVVLYTDGITEARNPSGELFGLPRLMVAVKEYAPQYSAEGVSHHVATDLTSFMGTTPQGDDITLIVMRRDAKNTAGVKPVDSSTTWKA